MTNTTTRTEFVSDLRQVNDVLLANNGLKLAARQFLAERPQLNQSFHEHMRNLLLPIVMIPVRLRFWWRNRHRLRIWEDAVASTRKIYDRAGNLGLEKHRRIYNVSLYVLLLDFDLFCLSSDMINAKNHWRRKFVARQMAVLLYEAVEDLPALLGGDYRNALTAIGVESSVISELNAITKQLAQFRQEHASDLQEIRNLAGAHRDHNAGAQLVLLDTLEPLHVYKLGANLSGSIRLLADWLVNLTLATGRREVVFQEYLKKGQPSNKTPQRTGPDSFKPHR